MSSPAEALTSHTGMSDADRSIEWEAQRRFYDALRKFEEAITILNGFSEVVSIDLRAWEDFKSDEIPSRRFWDAKILEARSYD